MNKTHMVVALRRVSKSKDENIGLSKRCIRMVVRKGETVEDTVEAIKEKILYEDGVWRIYRSVNKRDLEKAQKLLMIEMIVKPERIYDRVDSEWKSILMQKSCRAERNLLIDIDRVDKDLIESTRSFLTVEELLIEENKTPNGHHFVAKNFDHRDIGKIEDVEIKNDDLFFLELIDNRNDVVLD
jgi:hypothetical protein